ncbi:MAG: N-sulfoglucosamine sulfohydrolase, partial [Pirellulaceae bacterium]
MRHVLTTIALLFPQLTTVDAAEKTQPNFVIVIGDDVGWDAFGCTGTQSARTPNIDKLAAQSLHMERFYCSVSQCAPLRAEMYTGLLPNNNGVLANARKVSRPGVKNVADHLKPLGYRIGWTGKKHFGLGQTKLDNITGFPGGGNDSNKTY